MDNDFEIYNGKQFSDLCKDIVRNSEDKKNQIDILITDLRDMVKTIQDATTVIPLLKDYFDVGVRNDEQLIKLAAIIQRLMAGKGASMDEGGGFMLSQEEKEQLMKEVSSVAKEVNATVKEKKVK